VKKAAAEDAEGYSHSPAIACQNGSQLSQGESYRVSDADMWKLAALDHAVHGRPANPKKGCDLPNGEQPFDSECDGSPPNRRPRFGAKRSVSCHSVR